MNIRKSALVTALVISSVSIFLVPVLQAQAGQAEPGASDSGVSKKEMKEQRRAERKARRAKLNAEMSTLEKNGYKPAQDQLNYPQNLQKAENRASGQAAASKPAP